MHTTSFNVLRDYGHRHSFQGDTEIILFGLMRKGVVFIRSNLTWNHFHIQSQIKSWSRGIIEATWNRVRFWRLIIINFLPLRVLKIKLNEVSYIWFKIFQCDNSCFKIGQFLSNCRCMKPYPQMTRSCTHLKVSRWQVLFCSNFSPWEIATQGLVERMALVFSKSVILSYNNRR